MQLDVFVQLLHSVSDEMKPAVRRIFSSSVNIRLAFDGSCVNTCGYLAQLLVERICQDPQFSCLVHMKKSPLRSPIHYCRPVSITAHDRIHSSRQPVTVLPSFHLPGECCRTGELKMVKFR